MINVTVQNFTGRAFPLYVDTESTVGDLKEAVAEAKSPGNNKQLWQIENQITYNGHELRDHQKLSHYGISDRSTLHIVPPSRRQRVNLTFEKDSDPGGGFKLSVKPNITVAQLKREISIEEGIEVTQLKYLSTSDDAGADDDSDIAVSSLQQLTDSTSISEYSLEEGTIIVYTKPYVITVASGDIKDTFRVEPSLVIGHLKGLLLRNPKFPPPTHLCFAWGSKELDETKTFTDLEIPSEAELILRLPTAFTVDVVISDGADKRKLGIPVRIEQTLADFRESVHVHYPVPQSEVIFILVGRELIGESTSLKELGFDPGSVIHAVEMVSLTVQAWFKTFDPIKLHPLTRLSELRTKLASESSDLPLNKYWFTLDGHVRLKESRTLWDLSISSSSVVQLRPSTLSLSIQMYKDKTKSGVKDSLPLIPELEPEPEASSSNAVPGNFEVYQIEAEESESVWGLKERIQLLTGIPMNNQQLLIRGKVRENEKTLKQHGLIGGETLLLMPKLLQRSTLPFAQDPNENWEMATGNIEADLEDGAV